MMKIGLIGCGAIGARICSAIDNKLVDAQLVAVYDRSAERCERLLGSLNNRPEILSPGELIFRADLVIECASTAAVREYGLSVLESGKDLMVLSAGAFADSGLLERFISAAAANRCKIYIPSGAIAGIDGLKSASIAHIDRVMITTTKNPEGLKGAPYIVKNNIDLESFHEKTLLFEGSADDAIAAFPANINVAVSLGIAGTGTKNTQVRVFVDPQATSNIHEISVEGDFGRFTCRVENVPSPDNPRTSFLAALSAIATLKKIAEPLQIGT
ncbi:MAG: aspartate dehydrogenase [Candidatus Methanoperedens sp.]|nr:aspartate dehydrogenase [Candidatus Methanoperedens sp.]